MASLRPLRTTRAAALLCLVCVAPGLAAAPRALADGAGEVSLASLLEAGRKYHPTLAKQPLLARSLVVEQKKLNRAYFPQLSLNGSASWQSDVPTVEVPVPGVTIAPPPQDQYRLQLELEQSIWDGGATADRKGVAEQRSRLEQEKVNVEWYQVRDRIMQLYFAGRVQQDLKAQAESLAGHLGTVIDTAQLALENGVATERDVLLARAQQLESRQAIAEAGAQLDSVRSALERLTGQTLPAETTLSPPAAPCAEPSARATAVPGDLKRPELAALSAQRDLLTAQEDLEGAPDRPRIGAFATAGIGKPGLNVLSNDFDFLFIGGVRVTVPLTHLYATTRGKTREQMALQRSIVDRQQDAFMTEVNVQLDAEHTELRRLDAVLALDGDLVNMRERARKQTELQLRLGTATMNDLIDDLTKEDQARTRMAVHRTQRNLACHQLAFIRGDL